MIGLEPTFDEHLANLVAVFREVRRVLRDDASLWLNYGDAYNAYNGGAGPSSKLSKTQSAARPQLDTGYGLRSKVLKPKDLMMMPARVAMALQADGAADVKAMQVIDRVRNEIVDTYESYEAIPDKVRSVLERLDQEYAQAKGDSWWLRSKIIWAKPNPMPESVTDRPTSSYEELFLLTKSPRYFYDAEAVRLPSDGWHGKDKPTHANDQLLSPQGQGPRNLRGQYAKPYEGQGGKDFAETGAQDARSTKARIVEGVRNGTITGANLRNVWTISTHSFPGAHFATFPPALVEPCIKAGTSERGVCGECGAPWKRQVERAAMEIRRSQRTHDKGRTRSSGTMTKPATAKTTGWAPTCECAERWCHECSTVIESVDDRYESSTKESEPHTGVRVRGVRRDVQARQAETERGGVLLQEVRGEVQREEPEDHEGLDADNQGLHSRADSGPSEQDALQLRDAASARDGGGDRPLLDFGRSGSPSEREQVGQPARESGVDVEAEARRPQETDVPRDVSTLQQRLPHPGQCPHCGCDAAWRFPPTNPSVVLDCFAGSGTVGAVALAHGRSFIGIEINSDYVKMGKRRTESTAPLFTEVVTDEREEE